MPTDIQSLLSTGQCYACYGASVEDTLELALLASILGTTVQDPSTPVPVLTVLNNVISWTVTGPTPNRVRIEKSVDGVTGWSFVASNSWSDGSATVNSNFYYRVRGFDPPTVPITGYSNVVNVPLHALATAWSTRVFNNGGGTPSTASINIHSDFSYAIDAAGVTSQIIAVCLFPPDNLIACRTPLIVGPGFNIWTNISNQFVDADLTVNGLLGNGTTKSLATGIFPNTAYAGDNSASLFVYESTTTVANVAPIGAGTNPSTRAHELFTNSFGTGQILYDCWDNDSAHGRLVVNPGPTVAGFTLGSRTAANLSTVYFANSTNAWASKGSSANLSTGTHTDSTGDYNIFCTFINGSGQFFFSDRRMSGAGIGLGLSSAQGQALYNAFQAARIAWGGGFV